MSPIEVDADESRDDALAMFLVRAEILPQGIVDRAIEIRDGGLWQFGQFAIATGKLQAEQISQILREQANTGMPFGPCAIRLGFLTEPEFASLQKQYRRIRPSLSEALASMKGIDHALLEELLAFSSESDSVPETITEHEEEFRHGRRPRHR